MSGGDDVGSGTHIPHWLTLPNSVAHERIDASAWDGIYVIGDVHGCLDELEALLDQIEPTPDDLVIFVGDLVRKGPDSEGVIELVRSNQNMRSIRGNNEEKLLRGTCREKLSAVDLDFLQSMPVCLSWNDALVVHGGIDPRRPLGEHSVETLLTTRSIPPENGYDGPFWFEEYEGPPQVFFGHTVLDEPLLDSHAIGLDTGCVYGGALTAYDYRLGEVVSVPAQREYLHRADDSVVEPE